MEHQDLLKTIGLSKKESQIYMALLELGPSTISQITQATSLHRPIIYRVLPGLMKNGLVSVSPHKKRKLYIAESPNKLQKMFADIASQFQNALPEMEKTYKTLGKRPAVKFFEGAKGIASVHEDTITSLKRGDIYYRYSSALHNSSAEKYLPKNFRALRDQKQIQRFVITSENIAKTKKPDLNRAVKTLPKQDDQFQFGISLIIYGHKIALLDYNTETAIVIENPVIAEFQKKIFKILYDKL